MSDAEKTRRLLGEHDEADSEEAREVAETAHNLDEETAARIDRIMSIPDGVSKSELAKTAYSDRGDSELAAAMATYAQQNIEDWDFRHCSRDDPAYDPVADLFLMQNYPTVVAIDLFRLSIITTLIEHGFASKTPDGEHAQFEDENRGDGYLKGMQSAFSRVTGDGRERRKIMEALRRENRKYGKLRITLLPRD